MKILIGNESGVFALVCGLHTKFGVDSPIGMIDQYVMKEIVSIFMDSIDTRHAPDSLEWFKTIVACVFDIAVADVRINIVPMGNSKMGAHVTFTLNSREVRLKTFCIGSPIIDPIVSESILLPGETAKIKRISDGVQGFTFNS